MSVALHDRQHYQIGDDIIKEGENALHFFIVEKGKVEVWKWAVGDKKILTQLGPGQIFGEMALLDKSPRMATVTAIEPTICIRISEKKLNEMLNICPPFIRALVKVLVKNLRNAQ